MPRAPRIKDAGFLHHVISLGNDRQPLFKSTADFQTYIDLLEEGRKKYPLKIYNFVLMTNHVHLLIEPTADGNLSKFMEMVSKNYAKYFNKKYDRIGHVFQGRFKSFLIQEDRYYFACTRYIDLNPFKAAIVSDPKDYMWSGFGGLAYGQKRALKLDIHVLYEDLGSTEQERQIAYRTLVLRYQGEELDLMKKRAGILGDRAFRRQFKESYAKRKIENV